MANTIKIELNEEGRAVIRLYGQDIDVTDQADENGKGSLHFAGDDYNFEIIGAGKKKPAKKPAKAEKQEEAPVDETIATLEEEAKAEEAYPQEEEPKDE